MNAAQLSAHERASYDALFNTVDIDKDGKIGASDASFFLSLGLEKKTLSEIWHLSDPEKKGYLTKEGFYLSLRLVALARLGRPLSIDAALQGPAFELKEGASIPELLWQITPQEKAKFEEIFEKADEDKDGFITGPQAKKLFSRSGLEMEDLGKIWTLSDVNQDRQLDRDEFVIAMYLINVKLKGRPLPFTLPPSLRPPLQMAQPPPEVHLSTEEENWVMSAEERMKYEEIFRKADDDHDGFVTGEQARSLFSRSGLPLTDLAKIWTLSDVGGDRRLDQAEFAVAMFFINARLKGRNLPDTLPRSLMPNAPASTPASAPTPTPTPTSTPMPGQSPLALSPQLGSASALPTPLAPSPPTSAGGSASNKNLLSSPTPSSAFGQQPSMGNLGPGAFSASSGQAFPSVYGSLSSSSNFSLSPPTSASFNTSATMDPVKFSQTPSLTSGSASALPPVLASPPGSTGPASRQGEEMKAKIEEIRNLALLQQKAKEEAERKLEEQRKRTQELEAQLEGEEAHLQTLSSQVKRLQLDLENEKTQTATVQSKLTAARERGQALKDQYEELQRLRTEKAAANKEQEQLLRNIQKQLEERQAAIDKQKQEIEQLNQVSASLVSKRAALEEQVALLDSQARANQALIASLQEQTRSTEAQVNRLSALVTARKEEAAASLTIPSNVDITSISAPMSAPIPISAPSAISSSPFSPQNTPSATPDFFSQFSAMSLQPPATPYDLNTNLEQPTSITKKLPPIPNKPKNPSMDIQDFFSLMSGGGSLDANETREFFGSGSGPRIGGAPKTNEHQQQQQLSSTSPSLGWSSGFDFGRVSSSPLSSSDPTLLFTGEDNSAHTLPSNVNPANLFGSDDAFA
jgi:epidermal growth factor receptor substrate 15